LAEQNHIVDWRLFILIGMVAVWAAHLVLKKRHDQIVNTHGALDLAPDEDRILQMFARTRDFKFRGFMVSGSAYDGKLVLTSSRLVYTTYDEKRVGATFSPEQVLAIETGKHGFPVKFPSLTLTYRPVSGSPASRATWSRPGVTMGPPGHLITETGESATVEEFVARLREWKDAAGATQPQSATTKTAPADERNARR
jgi:hypothetical protein